MGEKTQETKLIHKESKDCYELRDSAVLKPCEVDLNEKKVRILPYLTFALTPGLSGSMRQVIRPFFDHFEVIIGFST